MTSRELIPPSPPFSSCKIHLLRHAMFFREARQGPLEAFHGRTDETGSDDGMPRIFVRHGRIDNGGHVGLYDLPDIDSNVRSLDAQCGDEVIGALPYRDLPHLPDRKSTR